MMIKGFSRRSIAAVLMAGVALAACSKPEEKAAAVYREAAEAILSQAPNARASAGAVEPPITGAIPMPRRRPVTRP